MKRSLQIVLIVGLGGLLFSSYLSYQELFATCTAGCPIVQAPGGILGVPACVYGFFMYALIVAVASVGLWKK